MSHLVMERRYADELVADKWAPFEAITDDSTLAVEEILEHVPDFSDLSYFEDPVVVEIQPAQQGTNPNDIYAIFDVEDSGTVLVNYTKLSDYMVDRIFAYGETPAQHNAKMQQLDACMANADETGVQQLCREAEDQMTGWCYGLFTIRVLTDQEAQQLPNWNTNTSSKMVDMLHANGYSMTEDGTFKKVNSQCDKNGINWAYEKPEDNQTEKVQSTVDVNELTDLLKGLT